MNTTFRLRCKSAPMARLLPAWPSPAVLLLLLLVLMSGCSREPAPGSGSAIDAAPAPAASDAFVLLDASGGDWQGRPALQLRFSQPLIAEQAFDERIQVSDANGATVEGGWVLDDSDPAVLRFPWVQGDTTYRVSFNGGLTTPDGRTLEGLPEQEVYSGNLSPTVGFASRGSVLPSRGTQGLPLVSVNTPEVDVEFFRVREKSLSEFLSRYSSSESRGYWELSRIQSLADSVYANRFALGGRTNQRQVSFLPVHTIAELREPGVYFAVLRRAGSYDGSFETTHFHVSDLGLHARQHHDGLFVHAASLDSGQPRNGVEVHLQDEKGQVLARAVTDSDGEAKLQVQPRQPHVLIARQGGELALISFRQPALDLSEFNVAGRRHTAQDVYAWSGRDLFRPGETLQVSALLRDHDGRMLPDQQTLYATLRQPDGRAISTLPLEPQAQAYYHYQRSIAEDAPTGRWAVEYRLDPTAAEPLGRFTFRVEEFLPERLKLTLDSPDVRLQPGQPLRLQVEGAFLYGAPAAGNRFTAELLYRPLTQAVPALKGYFFGDPTISLPREPQQALDLTLDDSGRTEATLPLLADAEVPAAPFEVIASGSVFESGGRAVRRSIVRAVWPAPVLVGVRPLFDADEGPDANSQIGFEIVRADADGRRHAASALEVKLIRELRDYHWNWVDGSGWNTDFTRRFQTVAETTLALDGDTPGQFSAHVEWGEYRLEIRDPDTGLTMRYPFTAGWSWNNDNQGLDARPDKVKIAFDQSRYGIGDTATVTLTAPYDGPGVVLVEADGLLFRSHVQVRNGAQVRIPISAAFQRHDVYVTALVFRPADQGSLSGPSRAVGVAHLPVASGQRDADMQMQASALTAPGQTLTVELSAPDFAGETAHAVVEAVDLGILNLTGYPLPDAAAHFLGQRGLGVEAWDLYGRIIGPLEGERARLRYGGDAALAALPQARRPTAKVQTVALHAAPVQFDAQGKASVSFTAPDFNGSLRVAALAFSADRFAKASEEVIVRAPLVMEVSTPRVMAPGDRATLSVDLHNLSGADASYRISTRASAPIAIGGQAQRVELANNARTTLSFPLNASGGNGVGRFSVQAENADGSVLQRDFEITVRPAWPAIRRSQARMLEGPQQLRFGPELFDGLSPESGNALISIASVPPLPFSESIRGLIEYPYGCLEQTSSRLWPLVNLDAATAVKFGLEPLPEDKRRAMLDTGFSRISAMQQQNGRFSFWPGEGWADPQMTAYAADLLVTAKQNGLTIPEAVLEKALNRLNEDLLTGGDGFYSHDHPQHLRFASNAYAGYVLARVNRAPLGTLRALWDNQRERSITALPLLQLGIALKLAGDETRARAAIDMALQTTGERPRYLGDYGSEFRDEALLLALLYEHDLATSETGSRVLTLARRLRLPEHSRYWFSTQERLAIFRLGRAVLDEQRDGLQGRFVIDGTPHALSGRALVSREVGINELRQGVQLELEGDGPFWLSQDIVGHPVNAPAASESGIRIRRAWYRTDGSLFTGDTLTEGESLIAMLTVEAEENIPDALVVDLLPGGVEIENLALGGNEAFGELMLDGVKLSEREYGTELRYEEYRDDRYVAALKLWGGSTARLYYLVRAVSPGQFVVPPPSAEDMYRPQLSGIGSAPQTRITVVPPKAR